MIENRGFDSHSLRHLHDFVRQPTILDYFVRDSTQLGLDACAGRHNAGIDAHTFVAQAQNAILRSVRPMISGVISKSRHSAQRRFWCGAASELRRGPLLADTVEKVESCNGLNFWRELEARRDR